jgi:hypothetical protein
MVVTAEWRRPVGSPQSHIQCVLCLYTVLTCQCERIERSVKDIGLWRVRVSQTTKIYPADDAKLPSNLIVSSIKPNNELIQRSSHHVHLISLLLD